VLAAEWPPTLDEAARLLDRLRAKLGDEERTPVTASNDWFLIGNIPILANAATSSNGSTRPALAIRSVFQMAVCLWCGIRCRETLAVEER
jgi:hypothetical protein